MDMGKGFLRSRAWLQRFGRRSPTRDDLRSTAWGCRPDEFTTTKEQGADTLTWREREGGLSLPNPTHDIAHNFKKRNKKEIGKQTHLQNRNKINHKKRTTVPFYAIYFPDRFTLYSPVSLMWAQLSAAKMPENRAGLSRGLRAALPKGRGPGCGELLFRLCFQTVRE